MVSSRLGHEDVLERVDAPARLLQFGGKELHGLLDLRERHELREHRRVQLERAVEVRGRLAVAVAELRVLGEFDVELRAP